MVESTGAYVGAVQRDKLAEASNSAGGAPLPLADATDPEARTLGTDLRRAGETLPPAAGTAASPGDVPGLIAPYRHVVAIRRARTADPERASSADGCGLGSGTLISLGRRRYRPAGR